jgi:hypothetical protein
MLRNLTSLPTFRRNAQGRQKAKQVRSVPFQYRSNNPTVDPIFTRVSRTNASDIRGLGLLGITALVLRGTTKAVCYSGRTWHVTNKVIVRGLETMLRPDEACGYCSSIVLFLPDLRGYCYSCVRFLEKPKDGSEHHQLCKTKSVHLQITGSVHVSSAFVSNSSTE